MKLIKKINNNFALGIDSNGDEVILYGKGIGFQKMPCELQNLSMVDRTYYNVDEKYVGLLNEIPEPIMNISSEVVRECRDKIKGQLNPNMIFTLADHISFAIDRCRKGMYFNYSLYYDVEQMYDIETSIAKDAIKMINDQLKIRLPKEEIAGIAINIGNNETIPDGDTRLKNADAIIEQMASVIEDELQIKIDRNTINYSRYATHMMYLLKRLSDKTPVVSDNNEIYQNMKTQFPEIDRCSKRIGDYLANKYECDVSDEERLYLMLHINRLCSRERTVTERA